MIRIRSLYAKIILALLVTVFVPLGFSVLLVAQAFDTTLGLGLNTQLAAQLERGLEGQRALIEELKRSARARFEHLLDSRALAVAAEQPADGELRAALARFVEEDRSLKLLRLHAPEGRVLEVEEVAGPRPGSQRTLTMKRDVAIGPYTAIEAVFGIDEELLDGYRRAGEEFATYEALVEAHPSYLEDRFVWAYLTLLVIAAVVCVVVGMIWATHLVRRVH
ncbi:MAG: hypothetical protein JRI55_15345, partial [Deltaproteobacteria bacterium]|nr:hypothetical protein [Deltaproteobacteria bacterium]